MRSASHGGRKLSVAQLAWPADVPAGASQQLADFLAHVSAFPDAASAVGGAVDRAVRELGADVAAVTGEYGVVASACLAGGPAPRAKLLAVASGTDTTLDLDGVGSCATVVADIGGSEPAHLVLARAGEGGFTVDEVGLVRGMAKVVELVAENHRRRAAERRHTVENERLLSTLKERQSLLEHLSTIQRAISRRAPLQQVLDRITAGLRELLNSETAGLRLRDVEDSDLLLLVSHAGFRPERANRLRLLPAAEAGVSGRAFLVEDLVAVSGHQLAPHGPHNDGSQPLPYPTYMRAAMGVPVYERGVTVGSLAVATSHTDRAYTKTDQEILLAFAEHASLALADARTVTAVAPSFRDSLTGLASRSLFMDRMTYGLARAERDHGQLAVILLDLDRFKAVNDTLGHAAGDAVLIEVASRLGASLRASDTAARIGADQFAVLLHDVAGVDQAVSVADRIISALQAPFTITGKEVFIDSSLGIAFGEAATRHGHERAGDVLMRDADEALRRAKLNGKGRYEIFDPSTRVDHHTDLDLEADLRRAVARGEFVLQYQPIVVLATGQVIGLEALVRWRHPERGLIPPLDFIPLAEETGLIVAIGRWVLQEACQKASDWNARRGEQPPLSISVNLSVRQLQQPDLAIMVAEILQTTGLDPYCLVLELTESMLIPDSEVSARRLHTLKALGVRLAVDDFGTGYSSLAYLQHFPVDILKIDKSYVDELTRGPSGAALLLGIVRLGQTLQLGTVAEGIEDLAQRGELHASGCEFGQGFYFARPLADTDVDALLGTSFPAAGTHLPDGHTPPATSD
ncbi:MAG: hypothetical protein QOI74_3936 [Micromonosporaceae bacterium]|nr:hypothetical protein [Micromonosporaceae bacterium]